MLISFQQIILTIEKIIPINITFLSKLKNVMFIDLIASPCEDEVTTDRDHGIHLNKYLAIQEKNHANILNYMNEIL
jgi:hypothetical protein